MTPSDKEADWEGRYQAGHTAWDRGGPSPALSHWLVNGWLAPCRMLIPGCGRGYEIAALAARGFAVTAVDIAPTAVDEARSLVQNADLEAEILQRDLLDWQPAASFDAIYEQTALCALHPDSWPRYARCLAEWLRPGGYLYALFMQTHRSSGPPYHCDVARMVELFPAPVWRWLPGDAYTVPHPSGLYELGYVLARRRVESINPTAPREL